MRLLNTTLLVAVWDLVYFFVSFFIGLFAFTFMFNMTMCKDFFAFSTVMWSMWSLLDAILGNVDMYAIPNDHADA